MNYSYGTEGEENIKHILLAIGIIGILIVGVILAGGMTGMGIFEKENKIIENVPTAKINYDETGLCKITEEIYTELEPYTETECIEVPNVETICETNDLKYNLEEECYYTNGGATLNSKCTITNLDGVEGMFTLEIGVVDGTNTPITETRIASIYPQGSEEMRYSSTMDMGKCICNIVTIPQREVCYDNITSSEKCYSLQKYREVEKVKEVKIC